LSILQIDVQPNIKMKKLLHSVNIHSRFWLLSNFLQEVTRITMRWPWWWFEIINCIRKYALSTHIKFLTVRDMLAHCTENFQISVSFSSETICQAARGNAASLSPILRYQGYTKLPLLSFNSSNPN